MIRIRDARFVTCSAMDLSSLLQHCKVFTAGQTTIDLLPEEPAVYAFYDLLEFDSTHLIDEIDSFCTKHAKTLRMNADNLPTSIRLQFRGEPDRFKGEGRKLCQGLDSAQASEVTSAIRFLSFLNEPLYVGKTDGLKTRFRQHHDTGFLYRMKYDFKRSPDEFLLFAYLGAPSHVRVIESILIQVINPPFNDQKS